MDTAEKEKKVTVPKPKSSKKKKILIILGAIIVFIVGLIIFAFAATDAPVNISNKLITNIQAQDATAAYALLSSEAKDVTDSKDFATAVDQIGPILNGKPNLVSRAVAAETGSHNTATVIYDIAGSDGLDYKFTVKLTENDGKWEVDSFESDKQ